MRKKLTFVMVLLFGILVTVTGAGKKTFTLVIDAGHGGHDAGAVGAISKEKNINLNVALAFGRLVEANCPDVNVVYTRKTDIFIPLNERANIANRHKADLFISVHTNALPKGRIARGFEVYTLGMHRAADNLAVAKRENAVISLEKNYKQRYQGFDPNSSESYIMFEFIQDTYMERSVQLAKFMQQHVCAATGRANGGAHQDNLAVLRLTSMPGCLLELGFISTADEERFMNSKDAPEKYARGIYNAFIAYKKKYHAGGANAPLAQVPQPEASQAPQETKPQKRQETTPQETKAESKRQEPQPEQKPKAAEESISDTDRPVFKVQITTSDRQLKSGSSQFKGLTDVSFYRENGLYKYTVGDSSNYNEIYRLYKTVREKIPDAFIIAFKNGEKMNVQQAIREFKANR